MKRKLSKDEKRIIGYVRKAVELQLILQEIPRDKIFSRYSDKARKVIINSLNNTINNIQYLIVTIAKKEMVNESK